MSIGIILLTISVLSPLLPAYTGRHRRNEPLWIYALLAFMADITTLLLKEVQHLDPGKIANIFFLMEMVCFYYYFYEKSIIPSRLSFWIIAPAAVLLYVVHTIYTVSWNQLNTGGYSMMLLSYILLSILGYRHILHAQKTVYIGALAFFWGNTAIMVYACGAFFIFLFKDKIHPVNAELFGKLWIYGFLTFNITKNLLLAVALSKKRTVE